jgi:sodium/potassium-transporting ATPase subunit alpha
MSEKYGDKISVGRSTSTPTRIFRDPNIDGEKISVGRKGSYIKINRQPSASVIIRAERRTSDVSIAVSRRNSSSSLPSVLSLVSISAKSAKSTSTVESKLKTIQTKAADSPAGEYTEHLLSLDVLQEVFDTCIDIEDPQQSKGLESGQAATLLEELGPNVLTPPPSVPDWLLFLLQFTDLLMVLLELVAITTLIIWATDIYEWTNLYIGVLLLLVVFLTCWHTFTQERAGGEMMEKFRSMVPLSASVIRDGELKQVQASDLVLGDIVRLTSGDKVPADCRIISNSSMRCDQSMITGESDPVENCVVSAHQNALESKNVIFNGSLVVDGSCLAVVIRTGDATLIGTMVEMTGNASAGSSTLKNDLEYFVKFLTVFALVQGVLVFIIGCSRGLDPLDVFINGFIIILIGNIPQGLPATVTVCLSIIAQRMGAQNVFVKKLDIVETLGSCTCICTDKTGTLTMNLMSVSNLWSFNETQSNDKFTEAAEATQSDTAQSPQALWVTRIGSLNSRVVLQKKDESSVSTPNGDASELGFYRYFSNIVRGRYGTEMEAFRQAHPKVAEIPFNSAFKFQMSVHQFAEGEGVEGLGGNGAGEGESVCRQVLFIKGAADVLLPKCSRYMDRDGVCQPIDEAFTAAFEKAVSAFSGQGERVLGLVMRPMQRDYEVETALDPGYKETLKERLIGGGSNDIADLVFVGLITLTDPPRPEVAKAVQDCKTAGVMVVMVTGDHPKTAAAIARKIGLITNPTREELAEERGVDPSQVPEEDVHAVVIHGVAIPKMSEADWAVVLAKREIVFARTSPEHKLIIVREFTKGGHITAMTGDGVNDSPALKQAAIGVAMGQMGSNVAKEAADIILLDDNFASIVIGIKEGRLLFANLKKSMAYTLAHLVPEVLPVIMWSFFGIPQPMGPLTTLCIDLLTELVPAASFAEETPESLIMQIPPRNAKRDKLTSFPLLFYAYGQAGMILTGACFFTYFQTFAIYGISARDLFIMDNQYFNYQDNPTYTSPSSGKTYTDGEQQDILAMVQGTWFLMIVCGQAAHGITCRTTTISIFTHGIFSNKMMNYGVVIALCLGCFVVYVPGLQEIVNTANVDSLIILYGSIISASAMWSYTEGRKYFTRSYPDHWLNGYLAW